MTCTRLQRIKVPLPLLLEGRARIRRAGCAARPRGPWPGGESSFLVGEAEGRVFGGSTHPKSDPGCCHLLGVSASNLSQAC